MRNPKRIPEILEKISTLWKANPDIRLMQLLMNEIRPDDPCPSLYYFEDEELLLRLSVRSSASSD